MVFSSYEFMYIFLPLTLAGYFLLGKKFSHKIQHIFLVLASLFFYGYFNVSYLWIILCSAVVNFAAAKAMTHFGSAGTSVVSACRKRKIILIAGIIFNVGLLGYFKYTDFILENINAVFGGDIALPGILLPLGISFFTFQQFSFLLSVYSGANEVTDFLTYTLFVTFFPQLVAGPIVLYDEMMPQFADEARRQANFDNISKGLFVFAAGLFKKAVIADTVAVFVDNGFMMGNFGLFSSWAIALAYTMQIYFDFSGYSDMAIGLGKMFNVNITENFNSPYKSKSVSEFWRRWHITLGRALSSYIYIPLGGNRKGKARTYFNLMLTFLVSGIWHGAAWTFVLWGVLHGAASVIERIFEKPISRIPGAVRTVLTFLFVNTAWVLFRAPSISIALKIIRGMLDFSNLDMAGLYRLTYDGIVGMPGKLSLIYISAILIILLAAVFFAPNVSGISKKFKPDKKFVIVTVILIILSTVHLSRQSVFIYFNF